MRRRAKGRWIARRAMPALLIVSVTAGLLPAPAHAATPLLTAVVRVAAPLLARLDAISEPRPTGGIAPQEPQEQRPEPPPVLDPAAGPVFSIFGGSIWSGASAFQTGAAFAYFLGDKASFGFEVEGAVTFGPGGRVSQVMGSFVWQTGARTSKFVPYFAAGAGYLHATSGYPSATQEVLDEFGIDPQPKTEQGPFLQYGGGLRFYLKPRIAIRADVRFALVPLDLEVDPGFWDRLYSMRRIAGMLSWDF
jgi:hypothetical protein